MAAAAEVGLQDFPKQIPFQQAVGHGQKLLDHFVEILGRVGKTKINNSFLTTTISMVLQHPGICMTVVCQQWFQNFLARKPQNLKKNVGKKQFFIVISP